MTPTPNRRAEMQRNLDQLADSRLYPEDVLMRMAATRGLTFRGKDCSGLQVRSDEFRRESRLSTTPEPAGTPRSTTLTPPKLKPKTEKTRPKADKPPAGVERKLGLNEELAFAEACHGLLGVDGTNLLRTAYHEAGHAVVGHALYSEAPGASSRAGFKVTGAEVEHLASGIWCGVPYPEGAYRGEVTYRGTATGKFPPRANIRSLLAGAAAEDLRFCGITDKPRSDLAKATAEAKRADAEGTPEELDALLGHEWRLVKRTLLDHWASVETVAAALLQESRLMELSSTRSSGY